jgi:hypothetical protein
LGGGCSNLPDMYLRPASIEETNHQRLRANVLGNLWRLSSSRSKTVLTIRRQGGVPIGPSQQINVGYAKIFATGHFMSACSRWNEKSAAEKTWTHFKSHFAAARRQHKQMQGETAANAGYHSANAAITQNEDQMYEATIGALANLATATAADRGVVAALTQANSRLVKQLEENSSELRELKALLNQERRNKRGPRSFNPSSINYCCTHGYKVGKTHTSRTCNTPQSGHKAEATRAENMGGSQANKE